MILNVRKIENKLMSFEVICFIKHKMDKSLIMKYFLKIVWQFWKIVA